MAFGNGKNRVPENACIQFRVRVVRGERNEEEVQQRLVPKVEEQSKLDPFH